MIEEHEVESCAWAIWRDCYELSEAIAGGCKLSGDAQSWVEVSIKKLKRALKDNNKN